MSRAPAAPPRRPGPRWTAFILAGLLLAGAGAILLVERHNAAEREAAEAAAVAIADAGAEAAAHHLSRTLEWVETLHGLGATLWLARNGGAAFDAELIGSHLREAAAERRLSVLQVAVIDRTGRLAWSTVPDFRPVDLSDREHFAIHRDGRREPFVSRPLVGRASGTWSVQFTRPAAMQDGGFGGVVVVSVDPVLLSSHLAEIRVVEGAYVTILRDDGAVLARSAEPLRFLGARAPDTALAEMAGRDRGHFRLSRDLAGQPRLVAFRALPEYGLVVAFSKDISRAEAAAARLALLRRVAVLALLFALAAGMVLAWQQRARAADRAAAAARETERQRFEQLLEALPGAAYSGTMEADGQFRRRYISSELARMTGFPLAALAAPGSLRAIMDTAGQQGREAFHRGLLARGEATADHQLRTADGRWLFVREHCRLLSPVGALPAEVVGLITDITEERRLQAGAMAAAKLASLGEMAAGVAHELNQPCATIALAADLAALELDRADPALLPAARARLEEIARQAIRLRGVIDHFRTFGRADDGPEAMIAVADAVAGAAAIAAGALRGAGVRICRAIPPDLPPVRARLIALEQVLVNAIGNACDAMRETPPAEREIAVVASHDAARAQVALAVRDRGPGVPPGILDRVFEPFFTTKPMGEGTGLGLAIANGIVRGFDGTIELRNRPEGGAELLIRLPVSDPPDHAKDAVAHAAAVP